MDYNSSSWIDDQIDGPDGNEDSLLKVSLVSNSSKKNVPPTKSEWDSIMLGVSFFLIDSTDRWSTLLISRVCRGRVEKRMRKT